MPSCSVAPYRVALRGLCVALVAAGLSGCAHVHVDEQGRRHVMGLVWLTLPPDPESDAAQTLRIRSLGLSFAGSAVGSSLVLGWQDTTLGFVRNHRLVRLGDIDRATDTAKPRTP